MGWLEPNTTPDELKNANLTQKGQLSGVIKSSVGFGGTSGRYPARAG